MKYRVTEKHPFIKAGCTLDVINEDVCEITESGDQWAIYPLVEYDMQHYLFKGWIEEIQEPEFTMPTKDEVINKGYDIANNSDYNFRKVLKDIDHDLYYSGWMDCFDWIENYGRKSFLDENKHSQRGNFTIRLETKK